MAVWKKTLFLSLAIVPIMGVLGLVILSIFFRNPEKVLGYHAPTSGYAPIIVHEPVQMVREKIILLFESQSTLLPQPTGAEIDRIANEKLDRENQRNLECLNVSSLDIEKVANCQHLAEESMAAALEPQTLNRVAWPRFHFFVEDANDLVGTFNDPYEPMIGSHVFVYESRGFTETDRLLKQYLSSKSEERRYDLWLTEDRFVSSDHAMGAFQKTNPDALKKFSLTSEYTYKGKSILGTSDYIIHFSWSGPDTTQIELIPLFPRVLAGVRFEDGCHAAYCPRFVYDLRPVEKYDVERIELSNYIIKHVP